LNVLSEVNNMLCINGGNGYNGLLSRSTFTVSNSLQTSCHPETWRRSNKFKDLVDDLCRLGVKQRVFLHVNANIDTLAGRITGWTE
jgi:hypothetical protein